MAPTFAKIYSRANDPNSWEWVKTITDSHHRQYIQEVKSHLGNIAYQLSLSNAEARVNRVGWKLGRTSDVDLLTGEVNEKLTAHALLCFDLGSGMLNLYGTDEARKVGYFDVRQSQWMSLGTGQSHCFTTQRHNFKLDEITYTLVFENLDKQARSLHDQTLIHMFKKLNLIPPHPRIFSIPRPNPDITLHDIVGIGAFGTVFAGIHDPTGKRVAVKQIDIKRKTDYEALNNEIRVATSFPNSDGLIQAKSVFCLHQSGGCEEIPDRHSLVFPLAVETFVDPDWGRLSLAIKVDFLCSVLRGVTTLHNAGWMHRDISTKNILIESYHPPIAVLCDYGKAIHATSSKDSHIGPTPTLAPEVDDNQNYDAKIDVWGIALVFSFMLFPIYMKPQLCSKKRFSQTGYRRLMEIYDKFAETGPPQERLTELAKKMLSQEPKSRPTALESLKKMEMIRNLFPVTGLIGFQADKSRKVAEIGALPNFKRDINHLPQSANSEKQTSQANKKARLDIKTENPTEISQKPLDASCATTVLASSGANPGLYDWRQFSTVDKKTFLQTRNKDFLVELLMCRMEGGS